MSENSLAEFRRVAMTLSKRDLLIVSDLLMTWGLVAAQQGNAKAEKIYEDLSLEIWLRATR